MTKRVLGFFALIAFNVAAFISVVSAGMILPKTVPFGGRVITTSLPGLVTCQITDGGTAPVILSSNLAGLVSAGISATSSQQTTLQKINNIGIGVYRAIPLYTMGGSGKKQPKPGDWILGNQQIIPNLTTCQIPALSDIPLPVVKTNNYGVSRPQYGL